MIEERAIELRVGSLSVAEDLAQEKWAERVVSLVDPDTQLPNFHTYHHVIRCVDTEVAIDAWAPLYHDIKLGMQFCLRYHRLLIHCNGGVSRSPAFAIGVLVNFGMSIPEACDYVHQQCPNMAPNQLVLQYVEEYLQLDRLLVPQVKTMVSRYDKGLVLWCNECQAHFKDGDNCPGNHFLPAPVEGIYV